MMSCDEEITAADCDSVANIAIDLETRLFRIRNRTTSIGVTVSNRRRSSGCANDTMREHFAGLEERGSKIRRRRNARNRNVRVLIQLIDRALRASAVRRQIGVRENSRPLRIRDEEER